MNSILRVSSRARLRRVLDTYLTSSSQSVAQGVFSKFLWVRFDVSSKFLKNAFMYIVRLRYFSDPDCIGGSAVGRID
jgi:hypothetical protein